MIWDKFTSLVLKKSFYCFRCIFVLYIFLLYCMSANLSLYRAFLFLALYFCVYFMYRILSAATWLINDDDNDDNWFRTYSHKRTAGDQTSISLLSPYYPISLSYLYAPWTIKKGATFIFTITLAIVNRFQ